MTSYKYPKLQQLQFHFPPIQAVSLEVEQPMDVEDDATKPPHYDNSSISDILSPIFGNASSSEAFEVSNLSIPKLFPNL